MLKSGPLLLCLTLSLIACGPRQIVRTETTKVYVRTYVALDPALTADVEIPYARGKGAVTNEDAQSVSERREAALLLVNERFAAIRKLQPAAMGGGAR